MITFKKWMKFIRKSYFLEEEKTKLTVHRKFFVLSAAGREGGGGMTMVHSTYDREKPSKTIKGPWIT